MTPQPQKSPFVAVGTHGLSTIDPVHFPVREDSTDQGQPIPRRCNIDLAEALRIYAEAKAMTAAFHKGSR